MPSARISLSSSARSLPSLLYSLAQASRRVRLSSFPPYLMVQLRRYYVDTNWTPKKLEAFVEVPERLSLQALRGRGAQPGEELQPEAPREAAAAAAQPVPDEAIVAQLVSMGFAQNGSKRAAIATGNTSECSRAFVRAVHALVLALMLRPSVNAGAEAAMEWVLAHMEDADFDAPLEAASPSGGAAAEVDVESISSLSGMGFTDRQATAALKACNGSLERAADWLFSRMDDLDSAVAAVLDEQSSAPAAAGPSSARYLDGSEDYELVGFISHMGSNTACGHYVCHIKKVRLLAERLLDRCNARCFATHACSRCASLDRPLQDGRWTIFNDEKVAVSEHPPFELGYMYLYKRV